MTSLKENEESAIAGMVGAMVVEKRYGKKYLRSALLTEGERRRRR